MKVYIIKKLITANSISEAIRLEKETEISEVFLTDDSYRQLCEDAVSKQDSTQQSIGF